MQETPDEPPRRPAEAEASRATGEDLLRHAEWIRRLARGVVGDSASAEDLVQDAYVAALRHPPSRRGSLRPWLRRVVLNAARQRHRGRGRREERERLARGPSEAPDPREWAERLETERRLTAALAELPEPFRSTLMLRYYEGLEPSEIARRDATPAGTVRWRVKRGLELLRERLDDGYGSRSAWSLALLPLARSGSGAASVAAGSSAVLTGALAMNVLWKTMTAAIACVALVYGLAWMEVLPRSVVPFLEERPAVVAFRPLSTAPEERAVEAAAPRTATPEPSRAAVALPSAPEPAVVASAPAPEPALVHARVVDEAGNALGGVRLRAHGVETEEARSAADGRVELAFPIERDRQLTFELSGRGLASRGERGVARAGETLFLGTITMRPGGAVSGRVVDRDGAPLEGVRVTVGDLDVPERVLETQRLQADAFGGVPATKSESDGAFVLHGVSAGYARLWATAEGYLASYTAPVEVRVGEESYGLVVEMDPLEATNLVRGVVLDPGGLPVPGADLDYRYSAKSTGTSMSGDREADEDGSFVFKMPPDGRLWVTARDPEDRYGAASASDVRTGGPDLVLRLVEVAAVELVARDVAGEPVTHYGYSIVSPDGSFVHARDERAEREDGRASFGRPTERFVVRVDAPGYAYAEVGPLDPAFTEDVVEAVLEPAPRLSGRVTDRNGPVSGARVRLHPLVPEGTLYERNGFRSRLDHNQVPDETETAEDGTYLLTLRRPGTFVVRASADGHAPCEVGPLELGGLPDDTLDVRLGRGGAIEGRVLLPGGEDPGGRIVGLSRLDGYARTVRVGPDGRYRFERLTPGPWIVELRDEEIAPGTTTTRTSTGSRDATPFEDLEWSCHVVEGETTYFDLGVSAADACRLAGRFQVDGELKDPWVAKLVPRSQLFLEDGPTVVLGPGGTFELSVAEPGDYWLTLMRALSGGGEQYFLDEVRLGVGEARWSHELATGALVVEGAAAWDGQDVPQAVHLWEGPDRLLGLTVVAGDERGVARLDGVPAGRGRVVRPTQANFEFRAWETLLEVDVPVGGEARERLE